MWANAQRDGRPAEYRWRPVFNAAVWLMPTTRVLCSNPAKTRNPLKLRDGAQMAIFGDFFGSCICSEPRAAHFRPAF